MMSKTLYIKQLPIYNRNLSIKKFYFELVIKIYPSMILRN